MNTPTIQATLQQLREKNVIAVQFPNTAELNRRFRQLLGARWSQTLRSWTVPDTTAYRQRFGLQEKSPVGKEVLSKIHEANQPAMASMEQLLILKNYSPSTRRTYLVEFAQLLYTIKAVPAHTLTSEHLRRYFAWCLREKQLSANLVHSRINAVKFYYEQVLQREKFYHELPRPKKPVILPKVMGENTVEKLLEAAGTTKHKLMLSLGYGMGLRVKRNMWAKAERYR